MTEQVPVPDYHRGRSVLATGMDHEHYLYSSLPSRTPLRWPGSATVAVVVSIWVESAVPVLDPAEWAPPGTPTWLDVSAWSLYEYGARVGVFRLGAILDEVAIRASMPINDTALTESPRVIEYAIERGWEPVAHGAAANRFVTSRMSAEHELDYLASSRQAISEVTGSAPRGWAGPEMSESHRTPELAAQAGYDYVMDWGNDDQPYSFLVPTGALTSVPAAVDTSDHLVLAGTAQTPWEHAETLREHLDQLRAEGSDSARAMTVTLRAHLSGQPFRARHIRDFLTYAAGLSDVWFPTASELVDAYRSALQSE
jgi:allantoinase